MDLSQQPPREFGYAPDVSTAWFGFADVGAGRYSTRRVATFSSASDAQSLIERVRVAQASWI
jgi:hypothetical protein